MTLDEWVDLIKSSVGPSEFKAIGVEFLREYYGRAVLYRDGTGDGGVDAWVIFQSEPPVRRAAQFSAGHGRPWSVKLDEDLDAFCAARDALPDDDPARADYRAYAFVTTQVTDRAAVDQRRAEIRAARDVAVDVFDARDVASLSLNRAGRLWQLLAARLPQWGVAAEARRTERDLALLAFSFFHEAPSKYRRQVLRSAVAATLCRAGAPLSREALSGRVASLVQLPRDSTLIQRALRDLTSEARLVDDGEAVRASDEFAASARAALAVASADEQALRERCCRVMTGFVPPRRYRRDEVARRAVAAIFDDLGVLTRQPIAEQVLYTVEPSRQPASRYERRSVEAWRAAVRRVEQELGEGASSHAAIEAVVSDIASSPHAHQLAAAELYFRLTEHDAQELADALRVPSQRVLLDSSVALPVVCAAFDAPVAGWKVSESASALRAVMASRGFVASVPSVYLEEMAAHLLNARDYASVIEADETRDLERSRNYFVAHFVSRNASARTQPEFLEFLRDFGLPPSAGSLPWPEARRRAERALRDILARYGIDVEPVDVLPGDPKLDDEPPRDELLLRHDRAVVRSLSTSSSAPVLVCTADGWLRAEMNTREIVALDPVGLTDLVELVRPSASPRSLWSPVELAASLGERERELAAEVWDTITKLEGPALRDRDLARRGREFRDQWRARRPQDATSLSDAWRAFRDASVRPPLS